MAQTSIVGHGCFELSSCSGASRAIFGHVETRLAEEPRGRERLLSFTLRALPTAVGPRGLCARGVGDPRGAPLRHGQPGGVGVAIARGLARRLPTVLLGQTKVDELQRPHTPHMSLCLYIRLYTVHNSEYV